MNFLKVLIRKTLKNGHKLLIKDSMWMEKRERFRGDYPGGGG